MNVRAITLGIPLAVPLQPEQIIAAGQVAQRVRAALHDTGIEVQTVRLATPSLSTLFGSAAPARPTAALDLAHEVDQVAVSAGFGYTSFGAIDASPDADEAVWLDLLETVPQIVAATQTVFCSASVATRQAGINLAATRLCGRVVAEIAAQSSDGFGNLRFAATANCPPHIPFFPAAYHDGASRTTVGIALEAADLAVRAFSAAPSLAAAAASLETSLADAVQRVCRAVRHALGSPGTLDAPGTLATEDASDTSDAPAGVLFTGVDLSLAPFPADDRSLANAFERLGVPAFGSHGTLFVASFLTDCLERAWQATRSLYAPEFAAGPHRFGFSGLMLPVLEDSVLAARAAQGTFGVDSLLLYSTVCGLGLDTVPLPGDTPAGELGAIILDMATLAVRLDKPLTARLFPVAGKHAGDPVAWEFAFFAPSCVLPVRGLSPSGALLAANTYNPVQ